MRMVIFIRILHSILQNIGKEEKKRFCVSRKMNIVLLSSKAILCRRKIKWVLLW